jgi:hypothetical protein
LGFQIVYRLPVLAISSLSYRPKINAYPLIISLILQAFIDFFALFGQVYDRKTMPKENIARQMAKQLQQMQMNNNNREKCR